MEERFKLTPHQVHDLPEMEIQNMRNNAVHRIGMDVAQEQGFTGKGVRVAVIDSGFQSHVDFPDPILSAVFGAKEVLDLNGHGNHVRTIIYQAVPEHDGIVAKVLDAEGYAYSNGAIADGIDYAVDHGANVINISIGGGRSNRIIEKAIIRAYQKGCVIVCSAGNNGGTLTFPANMKEAIAVGAINWDDELTSFSSRDMDLDIVTYGHLIPSGYRELKKDVSKAWKAVSGTSQAAPWVSGECARIIEIYRKQFNETPPNYVTKNILYKSARILGGLPYGNGKLRAVTLQIFRSIIESAPNVDQHISQNPDLYKKANLIKKLFQKIGLC